MQELHEDEVRAIAGAFYTALAGQGEEYGLTPLQDVVLQSLVKSLMGYDVCIQCSLPVSPAQLARALADCPQEWKVRTIHAMVIGELLLGDPIPLSVVVRVESYARALGVREDMCKVVRQLAKGATRMAMMDFERSGYEGAVDTHKVQHIVHAHQQILRPWQQVVVDDLLAEKWARLEYMPDLSLGRLVWEFYAARGFRFPGSQGSAPPLLAQHDWVHVLADYGSTVESEIEVFSFIAWSDRDPRAFSLQVAVLNLFETGLFPTAMGLFEAFPGRISRDADNMAVRMADAMRRGLSCGYDEDLLHVDWFDFATWHVDDVRAYFNFVPKAPEAVKAGSVGPWEKGGISPFQIDAGQQWAQDNDRPYNSYGAIVA